MQSLLMLDLALCKPFLTRAVRGEANRCAFFFPPAPPIFFRGAPAGPCKGRRPFWRGKGPDHRLVRSLIRLLRPSRDKPDLTLMLGLRFTRGPSAASAAGDGGGAFRSSPARSARSAFAVQLRPRFGNVSASGICKVRSIRPACAAQRFVRRLATGPAVMPCARGAFGAFGIVLVCGPATTANLRLRSIKVNGEDAHISFRYFSDKERCSPDSSFGAFAIR